MLPTRRQGSSNAKCADRWLYKTRSGMAFALQHAIRNNQQRIIVAVPFITITEQNRRHLQEHL